MHVAFVLLLCVALMVCCVDLIQTLRREACFVVQDMMLFACCKPEGAVVSLFVVKWVQEVGVLPAADALTVILPTLVAFCLNTAGLELVKASDCLACLVPIFTTKTYMRALQARTLACV